MKSCDKRPKIVQGRVIIHFQSKRITLFGQHSDNFSELRNVVHFSKGEMYSSLLGISPSCGYPSVTSRLEKSTASEIFDSVLDLTGRCLVPGRNIERWYKLDNEQVIEMSFSS